MQYSDLLNNVVLWCFMGGITSWPDQQGLIALSLTLLGATVQAYLRSIAGSLPDHHDKVNIPIKRVAAFVVVKGLAFNL